MKWGSTPLSTSYVGPTSLTATVTAALLTSNGTVSVTVATPTGYASGGINFTVNSTTPTVTALSQYSATVGDSAFTLTITGTNFLPGTQVFWGNFGAFPSTIVNTTTITMTVSTNMINSLGTVSVTVGSNGGTTSNGITFTVNN